MTGTVAPISHIVVDDRGVARIAGRQTRVTEVVLDKLAYGFTPEQIHEQHPHLTLAQIYAAFAYYYDHQAELDAAMNAEKAEVERLRAQSPETPLRRRLREAGKLP